VLSSKHIGKCFLTSEDIYKENLQIPNLFASRPDVQLTPEEEDKLTDGTLEIIFRQISLQEFWISIRNKYSSLSENAFGAVLVNISV
jgi:hypothetical protein